MNSNLITYLVVAPVALVTGLILGFLIARYLLNKQMKDLQKKMEKPDKEQVRNMLSALGQKPSEAQVNRFIGMAENIKKKKVRKTVLKKKKK